MLSFPAIACTEPRSGRLQHAPYASSPGRPSKNSRYPCVFSGCSPNILPSLSFQPLTTSKFSNPLVFKTIQIAQGADVSLPCPTARQRPTSASPLECAVTQSRLVTPLECAVPSEHRALPGFGRSCPSVSSLESAVAKYPFVSPLECAVTKNWGGVPLQPPKMLATEHTARDTSQLASFFSSTYNLELRAKHFSP